MTRHCPGWCLVAVLCALCADAVRLPAAAPHRLTSDNDDAGVIVAERMRPDLKAVGDTALKGRGPGTEGEERAAAYIVDRLKEIPGVEPASAEGFVTNVPLMGTTVSTSAMTFGDIKATYLQDFVTTTDVAHTDASFDVSVEKAGMVFVGHGIYAPEIKRDDYKNTECEGKVLVMFTNEPSSMDGDNHEMQYYGRWSYKYEEGRRRKAAGVLLIHTNATAGYPFSVVLSSNSGEQVGLDETVTNPLRVRGWISGGLGDRLAASVGASVAQWLAAADGPDFAPVSLAPAMSHAATYSQRRFKGPSVMGMLKGSDPNGDAVVFSGHLDHLGVRNGKVYPGAIDNACGVAMVLELARAYSATYATRRPGRTILFFFPTGEEAGLLGSRYYTNHPLFPLERTVAAMNFDICNVWGPTTDVVVLGQHKSELGGVVGAAAASFGMGLSEDPVPAAGMFFRSDHFNFASHGVPGVWIATGTKFVGQAPDYYDRTVGDYIRNHYHQPSDLYFPQMAMEGVAQQVRVAYRAGRHLLESLERPKCFNPNKTCL